MRLPPKSLWLFATVDLSILGMGFHTVREFGWDGLLALSTGFLPIAGLQYALLIAWLLLPAQRANLSAALAITGLFQLLGGAILSVLPLPFLPFEPEQTVSHYLSHLILGLTQIPVIVIPWRMDNTNKDALN